MDFDQSQLVYSADQLLSDPAYAQPLFAGGVLCHGGFDPDGTYRSPRTEHRNPAVNAWQNRLAAEGQPLIELHEALVPPQFPSVDQARLLLKQGLRDPIVRSLTVISILEGFGAIIVGSPGTELEFAL